MLCAIFCLVSFIDMAQIQYDVNAGRPGATINGAMAGAGGARLCTAWPVHGSRLAIRSMAAEPWSLPGCRHADERDHACSAVHCELPHPSAEDMVTVWDGAPQAGSGAQAVQRSAMVLAKLTRF